MFMEKNRYSGSRRNVTLGPIPIFEAVLLDCAEWGLRTKIFRYHTRCPRKPTRSAFHSSEGSK
jgi:hypothetical protein